MSESDKGAFWHLADVITKVGTSVRQAAASIQATVSHVDDDGTVWVQPDGIDRELPVSTAYAEGSEGDRVRVTIEDGQAHVEGNATSPSVGGAYVQSTVEPVSQQADAALSEARRASEAADLADQEAQRAHAAADDAQTDATAAAAAASAAQSSADLAQGYALAAQSDANDALASATSAASAASAAQADATAAGAAAQSAQASANGAAHSASDALVQLSVVQDVMGTLQWIGENCEYQRTTDRTVAEGTVYFVRTGSGTAQDPYDYSPVISPASGADPYVEGWYVLDVTDSASEYIMAHLALTSRGLWVLPSGKGAGTTPASGEGQADSDARQGPGYKALLASDGMEVYNASGVSVARYGAVTRIGREGESHVVIDYHSLQLVDELDTTYMHISDLRDSSGLAMVAEAFVGTGSKRSFTVSQDVDGTWVATDESHDDNASTRNGRQFTFTTAPDAGAVVVIRYQTSYPITKAYTLGERMGYPGIYSFVEGYGNRAMSFGTHAEGLFTHALGDAAHAEGVGTKAQGTASHAGGMGTTALGNYQTVIGKNNVPDHDNQYALIVGNGEDYETRSNALALDWDGNLELAGAVDAELPAAKLSGTIDSGRLPTVPLTKGGTGATDAAGARTAIGAAAASHEHDATDITSGTLPLDRGGTGATTAAEALAAIGAAAASHSHTPESIGAATASHTHTPASIGAATASHTHTPASIGAAAASHEHNADDVSSGTLASARLPTVPIAKGGTNATTAAAARTNLGAAAASHEHSAADISSGTIAAARLPTVPITKGGTGSTTAAAAREALGAAAAAWTSVASTTGTTAATFDLDGYTEVCVVARYSDSYLGSIVLPKAALHATTLREIYLGGWGGSTSANRRAVAKMSRARIEPIGIRTDGTDRTGTSAYWYVYAR